MTELEKMQWQTEQDEITLDYSKWSQQRTRGGLSNSHELWQQARDEVIARRQNQNAETRRKYLAGLEAAKAERQAERDAEIDAALEPEKKRLQNQWLADHPGKTESDFNKEAWHLLRENLVEQGKAESLEAELQRQMASGRYNL